jgi:MSHA pilin protein MshD
MSIDRSQRGLTLIELIMFIVIVGVALAGVLTVLNHTTQHSADPMVRKQALAIAEAILEEVMLQPFTWCDPDDANATTAMSTGDCVGGTAVEARATFDNVGDYNGLSTTTNIAGGGSASYTATVSVDVADLNTITAASGNALLITVSVAAPGETILVQSYRARHSPNMTP